MCILALIAFLKFYLFNKQGFTNLLMYDQQIPQRELALRASPQPPYRRCVVLLADTPEGIARDLHSRTTLSRGCGVAFLVLFLHSARMVSRMFYWHSLGGLLLWRSLLLRGNRFCLGNRQYCRLLEFLLNCSFFFFLVMAGDYPPANNLGVISFGVLFTHNNTVNF